MIDIHRFVLFFSLFLLNLPLLALSQFHLDHLLNFQQYWRCDRLRYSRAFSRIFEALEQDSPEGRHCGRGCACFRLKFLPVDRVKIDQKLRLLVQIL